jgi:signal peptidase I
MQCPSCRFENIPGLIICGRCGSHLEFKGAAIDVHPPRASSRAKRRRSWLHARRYYQARDAIQDSLDRTAGTLIRDLRVPLPEPDVAPRLIVPGWAHIHSGLVLRGRIFLGVFLTLLAIGLLFWGSQLGAICIGFAFSVHVSSVLDILNRQGTVRFPSMVLTSLLAALVLGVFLYWPIGWAASHVAAVREYSYDSTMFRRSDVVLVNEWAFWSREPRPGDVVLYETNFTPNIQVGSAFHVQFMLRENETIERVVGGPGDHILWDHGTLTINDSPVDWTPLLPQRLPARLEIVVPENSYLILPSTSLASNGDGSSEAWKARGLVRREQIEGMAYLRLQPLSRLWLIR